MQKLKRAVIKEELVELTGDFKRAIVLNQMIYWSERVRDFDKFIEEEYQRAEANGLEPEPHELQNGWIYKKAEELAEETMMKVNQTTMSRCLNELVKCGWLDRRRNPKYKMDKTYQYRVNLIKIQTDLLEIGYHLEGYKANLSYMQNAYSNSHNTYSKMQNTYPKGKMPDGDAKCLSDMQNTSAIPEITSKSTSESVVVDINNVRKLSTDKFNADLEDWQWQKLIEEAKKYNKDIIACMYNVHAHFQETKKVIGSLYAVIHFEIVDEAGWASNVRVDPCETLINRNVDFKFHRWVECE